MNHDQLSRTLNHIETWVCRTKVINILKLNLSTFRILKHHHKKMRAEHDLSATMLKNVKNKYQWHFYALFVQCKPGSHMLKAKKPSVI